MRARDRELGRTVAIKEMLHGGAVAELRFFREALITARLEHPGIVPVHEAGRWPDGTPFYAMKLVAGQPLSEAIDGAKDSAARLSLVRHVVAVSDAVAYAHSMGIIHRDLKPSNVIVGDYGETVVIDWGLAREVSAAPYADDVAVVEGRADATSSLTLAGAVLGTPGYMPPEQANGIADARSDVYAIGAMLSHVVYGRRPDAPVANRARAGDDYIAPAALKAIIKRATEPNPAHRYPSAIALGDDLRLYQSGQLVGAHRYSFRELVHHWTSQNRMFVGLAAAALVAIALVTAASARRILTERDRAESERQSLILANAQNAVARDPTKALLWASLYRGPETTKLIDIVAEASARGPATHVANEQGDLVLAILPAAGGSFWTAERDSKLRRWHIGKRPSSTVIATDIGEGGQLDYNPAANRFTYVTWDHRVVVHEADGRTRILETPGTSEAAFLSPTGDRMLVFGAERAHIISLDQPLPPLTLSTALTPVALKWTRHGDEVASLDTDGTLTTYAASTGKVARTIHLGRLVAGELFEGGGAIALRENGELVCLRGAELSIGERLPQSCHSFVVSETEQVAAASCDTEFIVISAANCSVLHRHSSSTTVSRGQLSADGRLAAHGDLSGSVWLVEVPARVVRRLQGHTAPIVAAPAFIDAQLVTGDGRGEIRVWPLPRTGLQSHTVIGNGLLRRVAASPDGRLLVTDSADGILRFWSNTGELRRTVTAHSDVIPTVEFSSDSLAAVTSSWDGAVQVTSIYPEQQHRRLETKKRLTAAAQVGAAYLLTSADGTAMLWSPQSGEVRTIFTGNRFLQRVDTHRNRAAFGSEDGIVREYDAETHGTTAALTLPQPIQGLAYSTDGAWLVAADSSGAIEFRNSASGVRTRTSVGVATLPAGVAASSAYAAVGGADGQIRIFRLSGASPSLIATHSALAKRLAFATNGDILGAICEDGIVRLWNLRTSLSAAFATNLDLAQGIAFAASDTLVAATTGYGLTVAHSNQLNWISPRRSLLSEFINTQVRSYRSPLRASDEERILNHAQDQN
jgi:WD40 repeat protein